MSTRDEFDIETLSFRANPLAEARFLLRPVLPHGHLGSELPFLLANLESLVGQPCLLSVAHLRQYLTAKGITENEIGGALDGPLSRSNNNAADGEPAKYFAIHDTSAPLYSGPFPGNINEENWSGNRLDQYLGNDSVAHIFVNRAGQSATGHNYRQPWRATKIELSESMFGLLMKGLFLHHELIQPRRRDAIGHDSIAPDPGFPQAQYERLALLYVATSVRRQSWLIPAYHCVLDEGISDGHDDPQKFDLETWDRAIGRLLADLEPGSFFAAFEGVAGALTSGVSPLFRDLVYVYAGSEIEFPQLKPVTVAQWMLESGRGTSKLSTDHLNFGGLKWREEMAGYATRVWYEAHDGGEYYCKFGSLGNFIRGYWRFIDRDPYEGWRDHVTSGEDYIGFIGPIYDTPAYAAKVIPLIPEAEALLAENQPTPPIMTLASASNAAPEDARGVVVIDPGHGGNSIVGGSSPNNATARPSGIKEKAMTLEMGLLVERELRALAPNVIVHLTRSTDVNVGISARARLARQHRANLFLSIHFNDTDLHTARGVETWVRAASNGNVNLGDDLAFARRVQSGAFSAINSIDSGTRDRGIKKDDERPDPLGVLNDNSLGNTSGNNCLACLLELEFIDIPAVDALFNTSASAPVNKRTIARAIAGALVDSLPRRQLGVPAAAHRKTAAKHTTPKRPKKRT